MKRGATEEEAVRGVGELVGVMFDERREEAVRDGKTVIEMEIEVSLWGQGLSQPTIQQQW